eukprot:CAMPEP_0198427466 /NCGR_PEP_ID=MMETSP1452-20131203/5933_1 /TAXON_ID=1181717 /ORGANISM="Synchroma pusillum, Strain CCMP3072" /LENGTH=357 /DNA_ID=CAMNT_0044147843 /DNA_START=26 /DNA_END=1096 /DNA_ORIENTATION=-
MALRLGPALLPLAVIVVPPIANMLAWRVASRHLSNLDHVQLFPTYAKAVHVPGSDTPGWDVWVRGVVYEPEDVHPAKRAVMTALGRAADFAGFSGATLKQRLRPFMFDYSRNKQVNVTVDGCLNRDDCPRMELGPGSYRQNAVSGADGIFDGHLSIPPTPGLVPGDVLRVVGPHTSAGARLIAPEGLTVVSDIDDTIKHTGTGSVSRVLYHSFLTPSFRAVDGMPTLLATWAGGDAAGAAAADVHLLSSSPWSMLPSLLPWLEHEGFPAATPHLRRFRLELFEPWGLDVGSLRLLQKPLQYKLGVLRRLLADFPGRHFVLLGDSSERDPEIYGAAMREFPDQVKCALIRDVPGRAMA